MGDLEADLLLHSEPYPLGIGKRLQTISFYSTLVVSRGIDKNPFFKIFCCPKKKLGIREIV